MGRTTNLIFTEYVRSLIPGEEPDAEIFDQVWSTLRGALCSEMKKRSLWNLPPYLFGVYGRNSWSEREAFEELASDCYTFIFLDRLPALKAQLRTKENIEGLVFRNIRNFLHDAQKKHDRVGYKTYRVLRRALSRRIQAGTLHVLNDEPPLGVGTVLGFAPEGPARVALAADLEASVRQWCDQLASSIVAARGRQREVVAEALGARISELAAEGIEAFRWKDLVDAVKGAVRVRWQLLGASLEGESALERVGVDTVQRVRLVRPDAGFEEREALVKLDAHVTRQIRREEPPRSRGEARRLWRYLTRYVTESGREKVLSRRQIAKKLGISRHRVNRHMKSLGRWVDKFRATG